MAWLWRHGPPPARAAKKPTHTTPKREPGRQSNIEKKTMTEAIDIGAPQWRVVGAYVCLKAARLVSSSPGHHSLILPQHPEGHYVTVFSCSREEYTKHSSHGALTKAVGRQVAGGGQDVAINSGWLFRQLWRCALWVCFEGFPSSHAVNRVSLCLHHGL